MISTVVPVRQLCIGMALSVLFSSAHAQLEDEDLAISFGTEEFVSIASGRKQHMSEAPAVTSVVTAKDIKAMGARTVSEALEAVPGVHVSTTAAGYNPIISIRGIFSDFNPQVLILINGIPITNLFLGNRGQAWGGMPVESISRIEVIRGPGSAIYGADAFAGAVNIITKTREDINGTELGARAGSFDTYEAWALHGDKWGEWETALSLEYLTTKGQDERLESDAQSVFDALLGTNASLAPGPVNTGRDALDIRLDLSREHWRFRAGYQGRRDIGTGAGGAQALDPKGSSESDRYNLDATYQRNDFIKDWDINAQASYYDISNRSFLILFPAGADFTSVGGSAFPEGVIGNPEVNERHLRLGTTAFYNGLDNHRIRIGAGYTYGNMWKIKERKNYDINSGGFPVSRGAVGDVSEADLFIRERDRTLYYLSLQDEWTLAPDWTLTSGLRYDTYSDFGDTVNPRLALIWKTRYNMTSKLLYGRAFRAPSFAELANINNPVAVGNPNLAPETIDTLELAVDYLHTDKLRTDVNVFYYDMKDIISFSPTNTAQNTGDQTGYGMEWESKWDVASSVRVLGNYAFQNAQNEDSNTDAGFAPRHQLYLRLDWRFSQNWNLHTQINSVHDRRRAAGDTRPAVDDYSTLDLTLRSSTDYQGFNYAVAVKNLFDARVLEPSSAPPVLIADDLPMARRSLFAELRYHW